MRRANIAINGQHITMMCVRLSLRSIGIAFVTFGSLSDAKQVAKDHRYVGLQSYLVKLVPFKLFCRARCSGCFSNPPHSSISAVMEPQNW